MSTLLIPPFEHDATRASRDIGAGDGSRPLIDRLGDLRILITVSNEGRPHSVCAQCFASDRPCDSIQWQEDPAAARELLADGSIDIAVLDSRCEGRTLLQELVDRGPRTPVILLDEDDRDAMNACALTLVRLSRHNLDERQLRGALEQILDRADCAGDWAPAGNAADDSVGVDEARSGACALEPGLLPHMPVIIGRIDRAGNLMTLAGAGLQRLGFPRIPSPGSRFDAVFPSGAAALRGALRGEHAQFEVCHRDPVGEVHCFRFDLFPDHEQGGMIGVLGQEAPDRAQAEDEVLRAVDSERQRIGADLHDEVGQLLTGITCLSTALVDRLRDRDDLAAEDATTIAQTAKEALAQLRSLAHGLAPVQIARRGLARALGEFAELVRRMHHIELRLDLQPAQPDLEQETATHVFRIAQEAVANAVRHGHASHVEVCLRRLGARYALTVRDNGCGFDGAAPSGSTGSGLRLMEYRAALIGGELYVDSTRGNGTCLQVTFTPTTPSTHENAC